MLLRGLLCSGCFLDPQTCISSPHIGWHILKVCFTLALHSCCLDWKASENNQIAPPCPPKHYSFLNTDCRGWFLNGRKGNAQTWLHPSIFQSKLSLKIRLSAITALTLLKTTFTLQELKEDDKYAKCTARSWQIHLHPVLLDLTLLVTHSRSCSLTAASHRRAAQLPDQNQITLSPLHLPTPTNVDMLFWCFPLLPRKLWSDPIMAAGTQTAQTLWGSPCERG